MKPPKKIWFPAKKYGWGWGPPCCWQGWVFFAAWLATIYAGAWLFHPRQHLGLFLGWVGILIAVFVIVCLLKGEKPGWHWGDK